MALAEVRRLKTMKKLFIPSIFTLLFLAFEANAQDAEEKPYVWPTDEAVLEKLDAWRDLKFGVLFHWGIYSVPGIVESWSLCSDDSPWHQRPEGTDYEDYKNWYFALNEAFYPRNFDPVGWAEIMADAGMKYMLFTSKHHDGFCMYYSKYTDYSIAKGPFRKHPQNNVGLHVAEAFRAQGFWTGWYFSMIDWHNEWFWHPSYAAGTAKQNYRKDRHPDWWKNYLDFAVNQMDELTTDYGQVDIMWLDAAGWVQGDEYDLDGFLSGARERNPGMLCIERGVGGKNENYQTPELRIPETQLDYPWESCIMLTNYWSWHPVQSYKSSRTLLNMLIEIVAKGGSLVLGVGPTGDGEIEEEAVARLREIGLWLQSYGKAIYGTRNAEIYNDGNTWFTASKDGETLYAIYALEEGEVLPTEIEWTGNVPEGKIFEIKSGKSVKFEVLGERVKLTLPKGLADGPVAFEFSSKKQ